MEGGKGDSGKSAGGWLEEARNLSFFNDLENAQRFHPTNGRTDQPTLLTGRPDGRIDLTDGRTNQ